MAKRQTVYVCQSCGRHSARSMGRCPGCGEWGTLLETVVVDKPSARRIGTGAAKPVKLVDISNDQIDRIPLDISEFSRVLGGGLVPGSMVLISGDPGIGKSTLLLQMAISIAQEAGPVLYVSGEESLNQIKMRADRLEINAEMLYLLTETDVDEVLQAVEDIAPRVLIVDSIQTMRAAELESAAGNISQIRACAARIQTMAKGSGIAVFLVGHVTKEGHIAGPKVLEHIVDTVLYLEGDQFHTYRLLRAVKNRFGATSEVGVFAMRNKGMIEVANPSHAFLAERMKDAPGSAIAVTMEGTRPILVEVQALTSPTSFSNPRRTANGVDFNRLLLLTAVLNKRVGIRLSDQDVFVNVVGGLQVREPAVDLAMAVAIASSRQSLPAAADMAFVGEIGLSGELRAVSQLTSRLKEASKLGFQRCVIPDTTEQVDSAATMSIKLLRARSLSDAVRIAIKK